MKSKNIKSKKVIASLKKTAKKNIINEEGDKLQRVMKKRVDEEINEDSESEVSNDENGEVSNENNSEVSNDENGEVSNENNSEDSNEENSEMSNEDNSEDSNEENSEMSNENNSEDSNEENSEEDSEDDAPTEAAIEKDEPTIPSKIKIGIISPNFPVDQIIHVNKLPKKCKVIDIVEVFAKYGPIYAIHIQKGTANDVANVAFKNAKAASAALSAHKTAVINGEKLCVKSKPISEKKLQKKLDRPASTSNDGDSRDRSVHVKLLKRGTTEDELREHFASCGDIESVRIVLKNSITFAFVTFVDKSSLKDALNLHNSILNGTNIGVFENNPNSASNMGNREPKNTIMLKNCQNLECVDVEILKSIFKKCGDIDCIDVVCKKNALAFITFKTEEAVAKAFKLNGKTLRGIALEVFPFNEYKPKTSIFITNLTPGVTEDNLKTHFSKSGDISSVILKKGFAVIHFKDSSGYCKSFLLNDSILNGQIIFVEPYSTRKQAVYRSKYRFGKKRQLQTRDHFINSKRVKYT